MRAASAALIAWLDQPAKKRAYCMSVTRADATVIRGTSWTSDIVFEGQTYYHTSGGAITDVESTAALDVGNSEIKLNFGAMTEADLLAGLYDGAAYSLFLVNPLDLSMGRLRIMDGTIGRVTLGRLGFNAELRDKFQALQQSTGDLITPTCIYELGSTARLPFAHDCTKDLTSFTVSGTLDSVSPDQMTLKDSARAEAGPGGGIAVSGISNADPAVITTTTAHGLTHGQAVYLSGPDGPVALNGPVQALNPTALTFEIDINTTNTTSYPPFASAWTATPMGAASGYFDDGTITIAGVTRRVKAYIPGQWTLQDEFPFTLAGNEAYTMVAGCNKTPLACRVKFANLVNFGGFPFVPGNDAVIQVGGRE